MYVLNLETSSVLLGFTYGCHLIALGLSLREKHCFSARKGVQVHIILPFVGRRADVEVGRLVVVLTITIGGTGAGVGEHDSGRQLKASSKHCHAPLLQEQEKRSAHVAQLSP